MEGNLLAHSSGQFGYLWVSLREENDIGADIIGADIMPRFTLGNTAGSVSMEKEGKLPSWTGPMPDI